MSNVLLLNGYDGGLTEVVALCDASADSVVFRSPEDGTPISGRKGVLAWLKVTPRPDLFVDIATSGWLSADEKRSVIECQKQLQDAQHAAEVARAAAASGGRGRRTDGSRFSLNSNGGVYWIGNARFSATQAKGHLSGMQMVDILCAAPMFLDWIQSAGGVTADSATRTETSTVGKRKKVNDVWTTEEQEVPMQVVGDFESDGKSAPHLKLGAGKHAARNWQRRYRMLCEVAEAVRPIVDRHRAEWAGEDTAGGDAE